MRITKKQVPFTNRVHLSDTVLEEVKEFKARAGGWGDSHMEQTGILVGNFEFNP